MKALTVANYIVMNWGEEVTLTNLKLNKLVYYCQVESLRRTSRPLFEDEIEAWQFGPVERQVYDTFAKCGRSRILSCSGDAKIDIASSRIVDFVMRRIGNLSAFDLVTLSHKANGAWASVYSPDADNVITPKVILASSDGLYDHDVVSLDQAMETAAKAMPNALRFLENS